MAKIPYLIRRKNVFYFRLGIPTDLREIAKSREIIKSLRTQDSAEAERKALKLATHFKTLLHDLKTTKQNKIACRELITSADYAHIVDSLTVKPVMPSPNVTKETPTPEQTAKPKYPALSTVIDDFLKRYDPSAKVMLGKLNTTLPIFHELIGDKSVNEILQADINCFFDDAQRLPVRRDANQFKGLSIQQVIETNTGLTISEKTFKSTYRACVSVFLNWAAVHYKDQGFPSLSVAGAIYHGERADGINKQRAATPEELQKLFNNPKMRKYAANTPIEKRYIFFKRLLPLLEFGREREGIDLSKVILTHHTLRRTGQRDLPLVSGDYKKLEPMSAVGGGAINEKEKSLSG